MFDEKQLAQLDPVYFNIITLDDRDVNILMLESHRSNASEPPVFDILMLESHHKI